jgi:AcrR family transcriptional regulator
VRPAAAKARLTTGLVLLYLKSKDQLVVALLDWRLAPTTVLRISPGIKAVATRQAPAGHPAGIDG